MDSTEKLILIPEVAIQELLIRDLVEQYPEAMPVLSQYGIDVCCGGAMTVPDAAEAHLHDPEVVVDQVIRAVRRNEG